MTIREFIGRLIAWRRRADLDRQLTEDVQAHIELVARDLVAQGATPAAAMAAARRQVLAVAMAASSWVQPLLFGLSAKDPTTYAGVGAAMLLAALAASVIPAMRAQQTDPNSALRSE